MKLFLAAMLSALLVAPQVYAATPSAFLAATVSIQNPYIRETLGHTVTIEFDLTNRVGFQPDVRYSVGLFTAANKNLIDEKVYDDNVVLSDNDSVHKKIEYTAPEYASGAYQLFLSAQSSGGFPYGSIKLGDVKFSALTVGSVTIAPDSCTLTTKGEKETTYKIFETPTLVTDDALFLHCTLRNTTNADVRIGQSFVTHKKAITGEVIPLLGGTTETTQILAHKTKDITVMLPRPQAPSTYTTEVEFTSEQKRIADVSVHFLVQGISATIQNVLFDKDLYQPQEKAEIQIVWSGSTGVVGSSTEARALPFIDATISGNGGEPCAAPIAEQLTATDIPVKKMSVLMTTLCVNPVLQLTLRDEGKMALDTKTLSLVSATAVGTGSSTLTLGEGKAPFSWVLVSLGAGLLIVLSIIFFAYRRRARLSRESQNGSGPLPFVSILVALCFLAPPQAHADTFVINATSLNDHTIFYLTAALNKSIYAPGEQMTVSGSVSCDMTYDIDFLNLFKLYSSSRSGSPTVTFYDYFINGMCRGMIPYGGSYTVAAPSTIGTYTQTFPYTYSFRICIDPHCAKGIINNFVSVPFVVGYPTVSVTIQ
jgi:hypothetical protein